MSATLQQRVHCRRCRFRFLIQVPASEDWRIEAQCPSCDWSDGFTVADTYEPPTPNLQDLDAAAQKVGSLLWQPIDENQDHPALAWVDRVGNGMFGDDRSKICWPVPWTVYRFTRGTEAAYIWQENGSWFVRGWHPMRGRGNPPEPDEVHSFGAALDRLVAPTMNGN
jgi:hypothetical protein